MITEISFEFVGVLLVNVYYRHLSWDISHILLVPFHILDNISLSLPNNSRSLFLNFSLHAHFALGFPSPSHPPLSAEMKISIAALATGLFAVSANARYVFYYDQ
jgi:hypothetical protein